MDNDSKQLWKVLLTEASNVQDILVRYVSRQLNNPEWIMMMELWAEEDGTHLFDEGDEYSAALQIEREIWADDDGTKGLKGKVDINQIRNAVEGALERGDFHYTDGSDMPDDELWADRYHGRNLRDFHYTDGSDMPDDELWADENGVE